ncbi:restriction endonuclease subunit S [Oceanobacillus sp. CAU 1775]
MSFKESEVGFIPENWDVVELKSKAIITMGQSPKSESYNSEGLGIPFMQGRKTFGDKYHDIDTWCTDPKRLADKGDILMSVRAPVGDVNVATTDLCIGRGLASLKMLNGNNEFLYYLLKSYVGEITSRETGTVFASINKKGLETIKLPFPSEKEQRAIAKILTTLDKKIEINNQINEKLEEMAQAMFKHWFVDFEFPNENGNPYKLSGGEMVMSELGMIPKSWEIKSLGDITALIIDHRGKTPKKLGGDWSQIGYTAISAKNIKNNRIVRSDDFKYLDENLYKKWMKDTLDEGDILMTSEAPLGETLYLAEKEEYVLSQRLYGIRANPKIIFPSLLFMSINSTSVKENINNRATGTTVTGIRQSELRKVPIIIPPMKIQEQLNKTINACLKKVYYNEKENRKLQLIRDTLLPKIMTGEINVPIDDEVSLKG